VQLAWVAAYITMITYTVIYLHAHGSPIPVLTGPNVQLIETKMSQISQVAAITVVCRYKI